LFGSASTIYVIHTLLAPVSRASEALRRFLDRGEILDLPISFIDRAGKHMADVRYAVERLDETIRSLEELSFKDLITGLDDPRAARKRLEEDMARARAWRVPGATAAASRWRYSTWISLRRSTTAGATKRGTLASSALPW
jgi:hypothetical protein